jgi:hypothetical protein
VLSPASISIQLRREWLNIRFDQADGIGKGSAPEALPEADNGEANELSGFFVTELDQAVIGLN